MSSLAPLEVARGSVACRALILRSALFLQHDRVRSAGGNFQSQEDVQRTRPPERIHLVSRNPSPCWGAASTERPQSSRRGVGLPLDRGAPPPVTTFLFILLTRLQWPRPLPGYAKKAKNQTKKRTHTELLLDACGFSRTPPSKNSNHTRWRSGKDLWHSSDARSPSLILSLSRSFQRPGLF